MGICLDTEQNNEELESGSEHSRGASAWRGRTPPAAAFPNQNSSHVKFEPPNVPVIFVLGGPGSGKVTHCDTLTQERRGVTHINMTDLLQQYAIGNDMQDFGTLSSKTVTEVLMLEMKMAPTAKTYLVSGYPRNMRDVAEYSDKIQTLSGVVLVSWRQRVLERQIEYGARLGHVVLSLARMELNNFYKNVIPVADYFDQSNMLVAVNGERNPEEVYKDFRIAVLQILGSTEDETTTVNGLNGVGVGASGIPGEVFGVEPVPALGRRDSQDVEAAAVLPVADPVPLITAPVLPPATLHNNGGIDRLVGPKPELIRVRGAADKSIVVWVVGGPGSNKATLCHRAVARRPGWTHFSVGQRLRALADAGGGPASDGALARMSVSGGELAPSELVSKLVQTAVTDAARTGQGLLLDGFPRELEQMEKFQSDHGVEPRMVLLDCSKLQLGRGRRDDSVAAFRRRLEVFRELSLPMLKILDQNHRLVIVDGDTDSAEVQEEFSRVLLEEMEKAEVLATIPAPPPAPRPDISTMQQFASAMTRMGGGMANGFANGALHNGNVPNGKLPNGNAVNGFIGMTSNKVTPIPNNVSHIPTISKMANDRTQRLYGQGSEELTMNTHI